MPVSHVKKGPFIHRSLLLTLLLFISAHLTSEGKTSEERPPPHKHQPCVRKPFQVFFLVKSLEDNHL